MPHYLVTGGAGFIGSHTAARLLRDGHRVRVLDNLSTGRRENLQELRSLDRDSRLEILEGDIRALETCRQACVGIECVIHEAALASVQRSIQNPSETTAVNVVGTVNLLNAARDQGVRRVVLASSSSVYGDTPELPKHERMPPNPLSPYAASKHANEHFARVFARTLDLETVSLRYFNVFGPRQDPHSEYAAVIPRFITALLDGRRPKLYGDGLQTRDFTYIDNVVDANLAAAVRGSGEGEVLNIACGARTSLLELLETVGALVGVRPDPEVLPRRPGDVRDSLADIAEAARVLEYGPQIGLGEGLARTVAFYRQTRAAASRVP